MKLKEFVVNSLPRGLNKRKKSKTESVSSSSNNNVNTEKNVTENVYATIADVTTKSNLNRNRNSKSISFLRDMDILKYRLDRLDVREDVNQLTVSCDEYDNNMNNRQQVRSASTSDNHLFFTLPQRPNIRTNPWCTNTSKRMTSSVASSRSSPSPNSLSSSFISSCSTSAEISDVAMSTGSDVSWCADDGYETLLRNSYTKHSLQDNDELFGAHIDSEDNFELLIDDSLDIDPDVGQQNGDESLDYEDFLNDMLESDDMKTSDSQISIEELIRDEKYNGVVTRSDFSMKTRNDIDSDENSQEVVSDDILNDSVFVRDDEIEQKTPFNNILQFKIDNDQMIDACERNEIYDINQNNVILARCESEYTKSFDLDEFPVDIRPRSLSEFTASLVEKVAKLREEKTIVKQRILEAQEEQRLRMRQKQKLRRQMSLHRRQLLLSTLQELKDRLQTQTKRLEHSYNTIATIQRKLSERNCVITYVL